MQVVRMQNFRNISPMSDLAWSGVGCPPLFLLFDRAEEKHPKAQNRGGPGGTRLYNYHCSS